MSKLPGDFGDGQERFNPEEMEKRVEEMQASGKMPSMEEFAQVMGMVREEWQKGTYHQPEMTTCPTGSPKKSHPAVRRLIYI